MSCRLVAARTPQPIIARLNAEMGRIVRAPEMRERLAREGTEAVGGTPDELAARVKADVVRMGKVIRDAGIRAQ
jgi:tripartite-type tricarboxylate transporter receptor subunit TctC